MFLFDLTSYSKPSTKGIRAWSSVSEKWRGLQSPRGKKWVY